MKTISATLLSISLILIPLTGETCNGFYVRETVNAVSRICYYNHMGSEAAITQIAASVCPTTVIFSHTV